MPGRLRVAAHSINFELVDDRQESDSPLSLASSGPSSRKRNRVIFDERVQRITPITVASAPENQLTNSVGSKGI